MAAASSCSSSSSIPAAQYYNDYTFCPDYFLPFPLATGPFSGMDNGNNNHYDHEQHLLATPIPPEWDIFPHPSNLRPFYHDYYNHVMDPLTGVGGNRYCGWHNSHVRPTNNILDWTPPVVSKVGRYSVEEKKRRIVRYLKKRDRRNFNKTIKYACRKTLADKRVRIHGRFAKNNSEQPTGDDLDHRDDPRAMEANLDYDVYLHDINSFAYEDDSFQMIYKDVEWLHEAAAMAYFPYSAES